MKIFLCGLGSVRFVFWVVFLFLFVGWAPYPQLYKSREYVKLENFTIWEEEFGPFGMEAGNYHASFYTINARAQAELDKVIMQSFNVDRIF